MFALKALKVPVGVSCQGDVRGRCVWRDLGDTLGISDLTHHSFSFVPVIWHTPVFA